jgi:hypothetical protein
MKALRCHRALNLGALFLGLAILGMIAVMMGWR